MLRNLYLYLFILISFSSILTVNVQAQSVAANNQDKAVIQKKYKLNPSVPLTARIKATSPEILQKFRDAGMSPTIRKLSITDSMKVVNAFKGLPPLHQQILKDHLLGISFLDNMPNTALTATVNPDDGFPVFTIVFRAEILKQNVSEWLTEKERSYFTKTNPNYRISIDAGNMDAILYVLLHEATHVVDGSLAISGDHKRKVSGIAQKLTNFSQHIWQDRTIMAPDMIDTLTKQSRFRGGGKLIPIELAQQIYKNAATKPFVSLYSTSSWNEDLAEYLTVSHFTQILKQPFKIMIDEDNKRVLTYEPMAAKPVTSRIDLMKHFYKRTM